MGILQNISTWLVDNSMLTIIGAVTLVQISPLKIDPWSYLGKELQGILGISDIQKRLDDMERRADEKRMKELRAAILDFANSCRSKRKHTYTEFQEVDRWNTEYKALVKKYNFENNFLEEEYAYIRKIFHRCQEENTFLEQINEAEERMR